MSARGERPIVLVGAGNLGTRIAQAMADDGAAPVAFADGGRALHDTRIAGVPVTSVEDAVRLHPGAEFVVTIWGARSAHRIAQTETRLRNLGVEHIMPFPHLMRRHPRSLPHYCVDLPEPVLRDASRIRAVAGLFADDASRREFDSQVTARAEGRFDRLPEPIGGEQYLDTGLFTFRDDEVVVDGGAFDGDSLRAWLKRGASFAHWFAVEPEPFNGEAVLRTIAAIPEPDRARVELVCAALGAAPGRARVQSQGAGSRVTGDGPGDEVVVTTIDALTSDLRPTLVKLDIEGAEPDALAGAVRVLLTDRPVLAVCAYHRQDHLWTIPEYIARHTDDYDLFLRAHGAEGWDLVVYAIPRERRA